MNMPPGRKYIGIVYECCQVYQRVYINRTNTAYEGRCPKCLRRAKIRIGFGGTSQRFFRGS